MQLDEIRYIMLAAFLLVVGLGFWKLALFFPSKALKDDDTTPEATEQLMQIMFHCIIDHCDRHDCMSERELYVRMCAHPEMERFWRFNENRLKQLLRRYYLLYPQAATLEEIYALEKPKQKLRGRRS